MSVGRICQRDVDIVEVHESAQTAAERMRQRSVGSLVVLNNNQEPVGIVTDRDLILRVLAARKDPDETLIGDVMTVRAKRVTEDTPIEDALSAMRSGSFRRLPVVDKEGKLVGLVSLDDILLLLAEEFTMIGTLLHRETPRMGAEL